MRDGTDGDKYKPLDSAHLLSEVQDEATAAMMEINARTGAATLAHFYAGFAGIVQVVLTAIDSPTRSP